MRIPSLRSVVGEWAVVVVVVVVMVVMMVVAVAVAAAVAAAAVQSKRTYLAVLPALRLGIRCRFASPDPVVHPSHLPLAAEARRSPLFSRCAHGGSSMRVAAACLRLSRGVCCGRRWRGTIARETTRGGMHGERTGTVGRGAVDRRVLEKCRESASSPELCSVV